MTDNVRAWKERFRRLGPTPRSVLFANLPDVANDVVHDWHKFLIVQLLLRSVPAGGSLLDIGCGYGRLADVVLEARPDVRVTGIDVLQEFAEEFRARTAMNVVRGDAGRLPFKSESFDAALAVTTIMYLPIGEARSSVHQIAAILKEGGVALFVDPGSEIQRVQRVMRRPESETGRPGFGRAEYESLFRDVPGCRIVGMGGNPGFTATAPLFRPALRLGLVRRLRAVAERLDRRDRRLPAVALHRWVMLSKEGGDVRSPR